MGHGPFRAEPSVLAPVGAIRLLRSAQLAAVSACCALICFPIRHRPGRPASSASAMVFDVPSVMLANFSFMLVIIIPLMSAGAGATFPALMAPCAIRVVGV